MSVTVGELPHALPGRAEPVAAPPAVNPWLAGISVLAGVFMVILDSTVVNVSLPHIAGNLSATVDESTWALTSYLAANAVVLPITGWLANYFGRSRLLQVSVAGFTAASFLCGLAPTLSFLIVCRVVQGVCGGVMQPLSQAVMLESFPPEERGEAMALWAVGIVVAPIFGPVIGGWLTDNYTWRWIFYINVPIGIVAFLMIRRYIIDPPYIRRAPGRIDYWGIGLLTVGIGALQIALDNGQEKDWFASQWIAAAIVIATVALVALVVRELRVHNPVIDLRVFKDTTYTTGVVLMTLMGFVLYGSLVILPIMLQTLMGYPPVQAGIAMAPRGVGTLVMTPLVGILIGRTDPRKMLAAGFGTGVVTLWWFSRLDLTAGYWDYFWPQFIQGAGFALLFVPLTTTTMDRISNQAMGNATSIFNLMRNLGGSVGIAIIQTMLARDRQLHTNVLGAHVSSYGQQTQQMLHGLTSAFVARGADAATAASQAHGAMWGMVQKHAAILAFNDMFRMLAVVFLVTTPLALLMRRPRTRNGPQGRSGPAPAE
jgi:MFS transporter, DHA2 family, multidrug resistance protein